MNKINLLPYITNPKDWKEHYLGFEIIHSKTKAETIISTQDVILHYLINFSEGEEGIEICYENK